jgi:hypothetical protein
MRRSALLGYQLLIGLSDSSTGALLIIAPKFTLQLMRLHVPGDALPFLSFIGAFVLSVGLACLYGAILTFRGDNTSKVEVVWLLTALTRSAVSIFIIASILAGTLESGWVTVGLSDGACVVVQAIGLYKGWLCNVAH